MIDYITEAEYERRFDEWIKTAPPVTEGDIQHRVANAIGIARQQLAYCFITKRGIARAGTNLVRIATWQAQRATFERLFVAGPTGPDKNAIPFDGNWKDKA